MALGLTIAGLAVSGEASAQDTHGQVDVQRWKPAPGADNLVTIETTRMSTATPVVVGLYLDYAHDPFRLHTCSAAPCTSAGGEQHLSVLHDLESADLLAAWTPLERLQLGLRVPISHVSGDGVVTDPASPSYGQAQPGGLSGTTIGDPEIEAKLRAIGTATSLFSAGIAGSLSAPLSHAIDKTVYLGDATFTPGLRAIADIRTGRFFAAANVGVAFRSSAHIGSLDLGSELRYGVGAGVNATDSVRVLTEFFASTNFASASGTDAAELDFAVQYAPRPTPFFFTLGGGPGLNEGFGAPLYRLFAGAGMTLGAAPPGAYVEATDHDHDGIPDSADRCPTEGGDVIRIPGAYYGCRPHDTDGDGVPDHVDACAATPGVRTSDPKTDGCPSDDRDKDGIPNDKDKCPDEPETYNGFEDADGCPDTPPPPAISVQIQPDRIVVLNERVEFETNSDEIKAGQFLQALDLVAQAMKEHPEVRLVEVSGYADSTGTADYNLALSKRRAAAVVEALVGRGVARDRLVANAHGSTEPVTGNGTDDGRAQNRRVQFKIVAMSK